MKILVCSLQLISGLDGESKFQMFTLSSGRNVRVNLYKIFRRISEVWENTQY